jgi:hypothetical protein
VQDYEAGGAAPPTGHKLYTLTQVSLMKIFEEDIGDLILLKVRQRKALMNTMEEHRLLVERLQKAVDVQEIRELVDQIDAINSAPPEYLGFKSQGEKQDWLWFLRRPTRTRSPRARDPASPSISSATPVPSTGSASRS